MMSPVESDLPIRVFDENNRPKESTTTAYLKGVLKTISVISLLYIFICSLGFLSSSFRLLGGKAAGRFISNSELLQNPVVGLMIGVLVTVLVQSSSTSTSIVVTMVGSEIIRVRQAIPIIMGANVGTSVTNTIVSLMQASDREEFKRAFAAATVHDMFNWLTVLVLLPIEVIFGYLEHMTDSIMSLKDWKQDKSSSSTSPDFLKRITTPFTDLIVKVSPQSLSGTLEERSREEDQNKSDQRTFHTSRKSSSFRSSRSDPSDLSSTRVHEESSLRIIHNNSLKVLQSLSGKNIIMIIPKELWNRVHCGRQNPVAESSFSLFGNADDAVILVPFSDSHLLWPVLYSALIAFLGTLAIL